MVTKKALKAEINFLIKKVEEISAENRILSKEIEKMLEKVEFLYRQSDLKVKESDSLFDEWMNGAKKEGEN